MRREIARALCTLALACTAACTSDDESADPFELDESGVAEAGRVEPGGPDSAQAAGTSDAPVEPDAALDASAQSADDTREEGEPPVGSLTDASAAPLDAGSALDGAASDAVTAHDARVPGTDADRASPDAVRDAGEDAARDARADAGRDAGADAAPSMDAATPAEVEAGAADSSAVVDGASDDAAPAPERATFTRIYALLRQRCRSCHQPGATYSLDFSTKQIAYDELVGGPNMGAAEFIVCAGFGYRRVIPFDPDRSLLVQKLEATQPCGDRMPPGALPDLALSAEVRRWIGAGAPND